jgi:RimJ/RimL family protein N-acetyltransferase
VLILSTPRLLLRPVWPEDAPGFVRAISFEVARNTARMPWPYTLECAATFCALPAWPDAPLDSARAAIARKGSGTLIGGIGFGRNIQNGALEIGYWLARDAWGQGYATEAGRAWVDAAFELFALDCLDSGHFRDNPASARVLAKLGFEPTGEVQANYPALARGGTTSAAIVRLTRARWAAARRTCS